MDYTDDYFNWIKEHENDNPNSLRLKYADKHSENVNYGSAITQIECRKKFKVKLNETLEYNPRFIFPSVLAGEQSTSDLLASFHTSMIPENSKVVDLTAGLGIDVLHFLRKAKFVDAIELDDSRAETLQTNLNSIGVTNVRVSHIDCRDFIGKAIAEKVFFDVAFIDPARRGEHGQRLYALSDCQPDVTELIDDIAKITHKLIIKVSPMLDITHCIRVLGKSVSSIVALGTRSECKELIIELDFNKETEVPEIIAVTLGKDSESELRFFLSDEAKLIQDCLVADLDDDDYIYEPFPAVMKAGAFNILSQKYKLCKISSNTRLLYSDKINDQFPGSIYKVIEILPYSSKVIKRLNKSIPNGSIATRNFGMSGEELRSRLKIKEGESVRIFGITDSNNKKLLVITRRV